MEIDFITALGRLLRDGRLRTAFAADPQALAIQMQLGPEDWPAWRQLIPEELEVQARILLRKRWDLICQRLPETTGHAANDLWPSFLEYARDYWPEGNRATLDDAFQFCRWLRQKDCRLISPAEWNRLQFEMDGTVSAIHRLTRKKNGISRPAIQILFRTPSRRPQELILAFGL